MARTTSAMLAVMGLVIGASLGALLWSGPSSQQQNTTQHEATVAAQAERDAALQQVLQLQQQQHALLSQLQGVQAALQAQQQQQAEQQAQNHGELLQTFAGLQQQQQQQQQSSGLDPQVLEAAKLPPSVITWDCSNGVYLDLGSNVGIQISKLYDPKRFPRAGAHPVFNEYFGTSVARRRAKTCAIGIEPNPFRTPRLQRVNQYFADNGWQAVIITEAALGNHSGSISFETWGAEDAGFGSRQVLNSGRKSKNMVTVPTIDASLLIRKVALPLARGAPIVAKVDIEGGEFLVMPSLLASGVLCDVQVWMAEWHNRILRKQQQVPYFRGLWSEEFNDLVADATAWAGPWCEGGNMVEMDDQRYGGIGESKQLAVPPTPAED